MMATRIICINDQSIFDILRMFTGQEVHPQAKLLRLLYKAEEKGKLCLEIADPRLAQGQVVEQLMDFQLKQQYAIGGNNARSNNGSDNGPSEPTRDSDNTSSGTPEDDSLPSGADNLPNSAEPVSGTGSD